MVFIIFFITIFSLQFSNKGNQFSRKPASMRLSSEAHDLKNRSFKLEWEDHFSPLKEEQKDHYCYNFQLHKPQCFYQDGVRDCEGNLDHLEGLNSCVWRVMGHYNYWNKNYNLADFSKFHSPGQVFSHKNISIEDGKLILKATVNPNYVPNSHDCGPESSNHWGQVGTNCPFTSGGIESHPEPKRTLTGFHKLGGRFEARIRFSIYNGPHLHSLHCSPSITTWPTFWFLPVWGTGVGLYSHSGWPLNGEIDVIDYLYVPSWDDNKTPRDHKLPYGLISGDATGMNKQVNKIYDIGVDDVFKPNERVNCDNRPKVGPWHDYAVEWMPNKFLKIYKDEVLLLDVVQGEIIADKNGVLRPIQIPVGSMHSIFELTFPFWASANETTDDKNRMEVDYIKYYRFCRPLDTDCITPQKDLLIKSCPNKGIPSGDGNCQVANFKSPKLKLNINYWIDKNPSSPGIYYRKILGSCMVGGQDSGLNCKVDELPQLNQNVTYFIKKIYPNPGVYYAPINNLCPHGGILLNNNCLVKEVSNGDYVLFQSVNYFVSKLPTHSWGVYYRTLGTLCRYGGKFIGQGYCQLTGLNSESMDTEMKYWVDTDPRWPGIYYRPNF